LDAAEVADMLMVAPSPLPPWPPAQSILDPLGSTGRPFFPAHISVRPAAAATAFACAPRAATTAAAPAAPAHAWGGALVPWIPPRSPA
jgi:hypothetical protein